MRVTVGLDHSKSALTLIFEVSASVNIAVVDDFEDASTDGNLRSNKKVVELDRGNLLLFQEDAGILHVKHLNGLGNRVVYGAIRPYNICLLVVPFDLKGVFLFAQSCHNSFIFKI